MLADFKCNICGKESEKLIDNWSECGVGDDMYLRCTKCQKDTMQKRIISLPGFRRDRTMHESDR
jgi:hypothetical protein